jgi:hypothetical protein
MRVFETYIGCPRILVLLAHFLARVWINGLAGGNLGLEAASVAGPGSFRSTVLLAMFPPGVGSVTIVMLPLL